MGWGIKMRCELTTFHQNDFCDMKPQEDDFLSFFKMLREKNRASSSVFEGVCQRTWGWMNPWSLKKRAIAHKWKSNGVNWSPSIRMTFVIQCPRKTIFSSFLKMLREMNRASSTMWTYPFLLQICPKLCYSIHEYACLF